MRLNHTLLYRYPVLSERYRIEKVILLYYLHKGYGRRVLRKGFNDYGVHDHNYPQFCPPNRPEYDIEHESGCVFLAFLLFESFPEFFYGIERAEIYELLISHDIGEIKNGDVSDDGNRDEKKKDREEQAIFEHLFGGLTAGFDRLVENFGNFQKKNTILGRFAYCIDKIEAVLQGLIYEYEGYSGDAVYKKLRFGLSVQDQQNIKSTGSNKLVDIWFESIRPKLERYDPTGKNNFFVEFVETAIDYVRSDRFSPKEELETLDL